MKLHKSLFFKLAFSFLLHGFFVVAPASAQQAISGKSLIFNGEFLDASQGWKVTGGKLTTNPAAVESGGNIGLETSQPEEKSNGASK